MSRVCMSHVTRGNESCHTCESIMSHVGISHVTRVTRVKKLCQSDICLSCVLHTCMSHVRLMNESCHTCCMSVDCSKQRPLAFLCTCVVYACVRECVSVCVYMCTQQSAVAPVFDKPNKHKCNHLFFRDMTHFYMT